MFNIFCAVSQSGEEDRQWCNWPSLYVGRSTQSGSNLLLGCIYRENIEDHWWVGKPALVVAPVQIESKHGAPVNIHVGQDHHTRWDATSQEMYPTNITSQWCYLGKLVDKNGIDKNNVIQSL